MVNVKYIHATVAYHPGTQSYISREPDKEDFAGNIAVIHSETDSLYIGSWLEGLGMLDVEFPKSTSIECTKEEVDRIKRGHVRII